MVTARELKIAIEVAQLSQVPLDRLPYTDEFERLWKEFIRRLGEPYPRSEVFQLLLSARKRGLLPGRQRKATTKGMK